MASIIRIKRSSTSGNPATLGAGELAYSALTDNGSNGGDRLYIGIGAETAGNAANHFVIGGKYFTDMMDHTKGVLTANSAILVDADSKIDNLKVDNLDLNGNTISSTNTNGNITLDPNGTGYVEVIGTNGLVIPVGTTAQRGPAIQGTVRYNTDTSSFEGYSGTNWGSLGGVKSVDGLTYISAELNPGASDDTIRAYTNGTLAFQFDTDSAQFESKIATLTLAANTASTNTTTGALVVTGGVGIGGALNVAGNVSAANVSATGTVNLGNISISGNTIASTDTNGNINITPNGTGRTVVSNLYIGSDSITEYIQDITGGQLVAGEGIDVTYNDVSGTTTIDAEIASTTNRGVASFNTDDFNVTDGAVELKDTVVKTVTTDSGALTPSGHSFSIVGGEGMDVTHSGTVITVAGEDASTSNKGIASFDSGDFSVSSGVVSIKTAGVANTQLENSSVTVGSTTIALGATSTTLAGLTEVTVDNLNINGNEISATDLNGSISLNPNGTGTVEVNGARITGLGTPTQDTDAATKLYVDTVAEGLSIKPAVKAATTANLSATYNNGTAGVGSTLTLPAAATLNIDGVTTWALYDGILVKDQTNKFENGRFFVSQIGNISTPWILTRCGKCDEPSEIPSMYVFVQEGTLYASTGWVATVEDFSNFDVGVDDITFTQFSGAGTYLAGTGLTITGSTFNVNGTADRIVANSDSIDIASTYVGQNSITTLGTITTGTWQGTVINPTYGGTGVNNGSKTITLGGSLTTSGAFNSTFTMTGTTSVTFPTSGTLATLSGTESLSNKTITSSSFSGTTGTFSGAVSLTGTTDSSSISTGILTVAGGVGIAKNVYVGDDIIGSGAATSRLDGFEIDGGTY